MITDLGERKRSTTRKGQHQSSPASSIRPECRRLRTFDKPDRSGRRGCESVSNGWLRYSTGVNLAPSRSQPSMAAAGESDGGPVPSHEPCRPEMDGCDGHGRYCHVPVVDVALQS